MKKGYSLMLAFLLLLCGWLCPSAFADEAADLRATLAQAADGLDESNRCVQPLMVYCAPRYQDAGKEGGSNLRRLSANQIATDTSGRIYGLYVKITPRAQKETLIISRVDILIHDKLGELVYAEGFDREITCRPGNYFHWDFFKLGGLYDNLKTLYGDITTGNFTMSIFFDRHWAGNTTFYIYK